jgi:signal transduction histidine kinase
LGEPTSEVGLDELVAADQLRLTFLMGAYPYAASIVKSGLYAVAFWSQLPHARILVWLGALSVVALARLTARRIYWSKPRGPADTPRWRRIAIAGATVNGLVWGSAAVAVYLPDSIPAQMLMTLVVALLIAGASSFTHSQLACFFAFTILAGLPLAIRLSLGGDLLHHVMAILFVMFVVASSSLAVKGGRAAKASALLRFRYALLTETLESRVVERTAELQAALALRDEFIMVASHELRTPLTSLNLRLQALHDQIGKLRDDGQSELVAACTGATRQGGRLANLVGTLLDVSSMSRGEVKLEAREIDLAVLVRRVASDMQDDLRRKGSVLRLALEEPLRGVWDPLRVEQILINLLSNALKYGPGRPISVSLQREGDVARLSVADEGIGIAPDDLSRIFRKYERAVPARSYGGLGLGLFVVQQLVDAMGGTIDVASTAGQGAQFTVRLPSAMPLSDRGEAATAAQH